MNFGELAQFVSKTRNFVRMIEFYFLSVSRFNLGNRSFDNQRRFVLAAPTLGVHRFNLVARVAPGSGPMASIFLLLPLCAMLVSLRGRCCIGPGTQ